MKREERVSLFGQVFLGWSVGFSDWVGSCLRWGFLV